MLPSRLSLISIPLRRTATSAVGAVRYLYLHEADSMDLMKQNGVATPRCYVANSPEEAENIYLHKLNEPGQTLKDAIIKAQVLSGGRGLGVFKNGLEGGVHVAASTGAARELAGKMLGQKLMTDQAPDGIICNKVLVMERLNIRREMYLSIMMDRISQGPLMIVSGTGGASIEDTVQSHPEAIFTEPIDIIEGITESQCNRMASNMGLEPDSVSFNNAKILMKNLYDMFVRCDCTLVEVNPLAETYDGDVVVCNAKVNFDANAEYRQASIFDKRDYSQEDEREAEASKYGLTYIGMDGNIGCMVNGAGLAMATLDMIHLMGGSPANFLDVGSGATSNQVQKAFEILNADENVKVILVNIFGGLMRCDVIAGGIISAAEEVGIRKPVVVRLQGTNVEIAHMMLEACGFKMIMATDLEDAATKAMGVVDIVEQAKAIKLGAKFEELPL